MSQIDDFVAELTGALERRDVPIDTIADIVSDIRSHVADSGEDPYEAYGPPSEYALQYSSPKFSAWWFWGVLAVSLALAVGGTLIIISGIFGLMSGSTHLSGLAPWLRLALGGACIVGFLVLVTVAGQRARKRRESWRV